MDFAPSFFTEGLETIKTPGLYCTAGKVLGKLGLVQESFDAETAIGQTSGAH